MGRAEEMQKYAVAYKDPAYRMGQRRKVAATQVLEGLTGSLLDVGCGRGEVLAMAEAQGMTVQGVEVVPALLKPPRVIYGEAWALPFPDKSFDHVTMMDVMEHLLAEDSERVCRELQRVARQTVILAVANGSSRLNGVELHINRRPYREWDIDFRRWFTGEVSWTPTRGAAISETWVIRC